MSGKSPAQRHHQQSLPASERAHQRQLTNVPRRCAIHGPTILLRWCSAEPRLLWPLDAGGKSGAHWHHRQYRRCPRRKRRRAFPCHKTITGAVSTYRNRFAELSAIGWPPENGLTCRANHRHNAIIAKIAQARTEKSVAGFLFGILRIGRRPHIDAATPNAPRPGVASVPSSEPSHHWPACAMTPESTA